MTDLTITKYCRECSTKSSDSSAHACLKCKSTKMHITITVKETTKKNDSIEGKLKTDKYLGKRKYGLEFFTGWARKKINRIYVPSNRGVYKERRIDRLNDEYYEKVIDLDSGKIIRYCEEPLSQHWNLSKNTNYN